MENLTAVILAGGKGTRLGNITKNTPKPLLKINNKKFMDYLIFNIARFGFKKIIIVAGFKGSQFEIYRNKKILNTKIELFIEKKINGTLGALDKIKKKIKSNFFIFNGDTFFNFNYLDLITLSQKNKKKEVYLSLRKIICKDLERYTAYKFKNNQLLLEKKKINKKILISGGIIYCKRTILNNLGRYGDLEEHFNNHKQLKTKIIGKVYNKEFIDIGLPKDFFSSKSFLKKNLPKKAIFLDRDGVLNKINKGQYIINKNQFKWIPGAKKTIKFFNDRNYYVFIITNQSGIGRGLIKIKDYFKIEEKIQNELLQIGAHVDKIYFCPYHEEAKIQKYRKKSFYRKPNPGMILKALKEFPVVKKGSFFIGDNLTDKIASDKSKIKFLMFRDKNLFNFVKKKLRIVSQY